MAAWDFTLTIDDAGVRGALAAMTDHSRDLRPAFDSIGRMLMASTDMRFERAVDPDGIPWTPLARSTARRKAKAGRERMLQWSGALRRSITRQVGANSVTVGTNLIYAAIQQFGGDVTHYAHSAEVLRTFVERDGRKELLPGFVKRSKANFASFHEVAEHSVHIPGRPYLGINADDRAAAVVILRDHLLGVSR